jgi:hypothetical protein
VKGQGRHGATTRNSCASVDKNCFSRSHTQTCSNSALGDMSLYALRMRNTCLQYQSTVRTRRRQCRIHCPVHSDIEVHIRDCFLTFHKVSHAYSLTATVLKSKTKSTSSIQVIINIFVPVLKLFSCSCTNPRCRLIQISNIADHELSRRARHDDYLDSGQVFTWSGRENLQRCVQTLICLASVSSYIHPSRARSR